jgi:hypothetical protein
MVNREVNGDETMEHEQEAYPIQTTALRLKVEANFAEQTDEAMFYYQEAGQWKQIGNTHKLYFRLDHFTGCRFGLFVYSTLQTGGRGTFREFAYRE